MVTPMRSAFSLLEMSIVLLILSLILAGGLSVTGSITAQKKYAKTDETMAVLQTELKRFFDDHGRLPCPARRDLTLGDSDFGKEILWDDSTTINTSCANDSTTPSGTARVETSGGSGIYVRIGGVPTRTLGLKDKMMADGFGNRITYVVMEKQTDQTTFASLVNGITINDGRGYNVVTDGMYALISHGDDNLGATGDLTGTEVQSCGSGRDAENCDDDAVLTDTLTNLDNDLANYFDDVIRWSGQLSLGDCHGKMVPDDLGENDYFGASITMDGDTVAVGAYQHDVGGNDDQGAAYVYVCENNKWRLQTKLTASNGDAGDEYGVAVAISGDTLLVGAHKNAAEETDGGAVYVYTRSGTTWSEQAILSPADIDTGDLFGSAVALDGDTALISSYLDDDNGEANSGSAYVFTRSGAVWTERTKLTASDPDFQDRFGRSVALDGDTALIGAFGDDNETGSAYVFTGSGASWSQQAKLTASDRATDDRFSMSVALEADTALIGAYTADSDQGAAYVYTRSGGSWSEQTKLTASDGEANDRLGISVALDGDTAVIGTNLDDDIDTNAGAAYLYTRSGTSWTQRLKFTASDGAYADQFGYSAALGRGRLVISARLDDDADTNAGSFYVFPVPPY